MTGLVELGRLIKHHDIDIKLSYGSGGFCVVIKHIPTNKVISGYSWSLDDALKVACNKIPDKNDYDDEEETKPDLRFDTSYKIINKG